LFTDFNFKHHPSEWRIASLANHLREKRNGILGLKRTLILIIPASTKKSSAKGQRVEQLLRCG
jgi:hypothetical protein